MKHEAKKSQKKKIRLPFSAVLMYLLLIAILLSGVTFSRYVKGTTVADSARVAYMKDISISETGNFTEPNKWTVLPGVDMKKNASVHFEGSEMACYIFLEIKTDGWTRTGEHSYACPTDGAKALSWSVDTAWKFLSGDKGGAVYYRIVSANTEFDSEVLGNGGTITVSRELTRTQLEKLTEDLTTELSIDIGATAVQYHGVSDDAAYTELQRAEAVCNAFRRSTVVHFALFLHERQFHGNAAQSR